MFARSSDLTSLEPFHFCFTEIECRTKIPFSGQKRFRGASLIVNASQRRLRTTLGIVLIAEKLTLLSMLWKQWSIWLQSQVWTRAIPGANKPTGTVQSLPNFSGCTIISTTTFEKKQVANATGKWHTTESLDQSLAATAATYVARGKKAKSANLKSPPSVSLLSTSSWRRGGAVAPRQLGASASSHFNTSAGTKPVRQVQLKMADLSPNPSTDQ